jgi:hypothetical protein
MSSIQTPEVNTNQATTIQHGEYSGKYSAASTEIYQFLTEQYKLSPAVAHKVGHMFACDYGAHAKAMSYEVKAKVGKISKDGKVTLSEAMSGKAKNVTSTPALAIGHAIQWLGEAGKHGVAYGTTDWQFNETLTTWLKSLETPV